MLVAKFSQALAVFRQAGAQRVSMLLLREPCGVLLLVTQRPNAAWTLPWITPRAGAQSRAHRCLVGKSRASRSSSSETRLLPLQSLVYRSD